MKNQKSQEEKKANCAHPFYVQMGNVFKCANCGMNFEEGEKNK